MLDVGLLLEGKDACLAYHVFVFMHFSVGSSFFILLCLV